MFGTYITEGLKKAIELIVINEDKKTYEMAT
jgi:hypothetical protein